MSASRSRLLVGGVIAAFVAAVIAIAIGATIAPALTVRATPKKITPSGVGAIKVGASYDQLRAAKLVGPLQPGCELAGPNLRTARLSAPLSGAVNLSGGSPRKVTGIVVTGGATARGVGVGASATKIRKAFPKARFDHSTDRMFAITLVTIPKSGGGRLQFALGTITKTVTEIAVPSIAFCE
jgi:hypothetical protein